MAANIKFPTKWIGAGVLVVLIMWVIGTYNTFVGLEVTIDESWSNVETQYQRRADLVPQLISTVKGAADFEQSTFIAVTEARTNWLNTQKNPSATRGEQIAAANSFDSAFSRLLLTVENYPNLKATAGFLALQSQLEGTENRIAVARKDFNSSVKPLNIAVRKFPANLVASILGFGESEFFESRDGSDVAPTVEFDFGRNNTNENSNAETAS